MESPSGWVFLISAGAELRARVWSGAEGGVAARKARASRHSAFEKRGEPLLRRFYHVGVRWVYANTEKYVVHRVGPEDRTQNMKNNAKNAFTLNEISIK